MRAIKKIIILLLPIIIVIGLFRLARGLPFAYGEYQNGVYVVNSNLMLQAFSNLPDLRSELIQNLLEVRDSFNNVSTSWSFSGFSFTSFDASSMTSFFKSIGNFFTQFATGIGSLFQNIGNILMSFFNAIGLLLKCLFSTLVSLATWLIGVLRIIFGF